MREPLFLTSAEVIDIHQDQIRRYGGSLGVRDMNMLQSAAAQLQASFGGNWLHEDIFVMAAAYAFHICENHPFIDGNKRAALASALTFLELNGISVNDPDGKLLQVMIDLASGKMKKPALADIFRAISG